MVCLTRLFLGFITLLGFYSTVYSQLDETAFTSDAQCYGAGFVVNATCPTSSSIALDNIRVGTRPNAHNCHGNETTGDGTGCCQSANDACEFDFPITDNVLFHDRCNGVQRCLPGVERADIIHGSCNMSAYPRYTQYMYFNYFCVDDDRISHMDLGHITFEDAALYLQSPNYPTFDISSSVSELSCSVETDNCNAVISIYVIERNLGDVTNSTQCHQAQSLSIIEEDGSILVNWTCNDNTYTISQPLQTAGNYILVNFTNTMTTDGGKFWIGFKASLPANLTLERPAIDKQYCFPTTSSTTTSTITTTTTASTTTSTTSDPTTSTSATTTSTGTTTTTGSTTSNATTTSTTPATTTFSTTSTTTISSTTATTLSNATTTSTSPATTTFSTTSTTTISSTTATTLSNATTTSTTPATTTFSTTSTTTISSTATTTTSNTSATSTSQDTTASTSASTLSNNNVPSTTTHTTEINTTTPNNEIAVDSGASKELSDSTLIIVITCCVAALLLIFLAVIICVKKRGYCQKEKNGEAESNETTESVQTASKNSATDVSRTSQSNITEVSEMENSITSNGNVWTETVQVKNEENDVSSENNHKAHNDENLDNWNNAVEDSGGDERGQSPDKTSTSPDEDVTDVSTNDESNISEVHELEKPLPSNSDVRIDTEHIQNVENDVSSNDKHEAGTVVNEERGVVSGQLQDKTSESPSKPRPENTQRQLESRQNVEPTSLRNTSIREEEQAKTHVEPTSTLKIDRENQSRPMVTDGTTPLYSRRGRKDDSAYRRIYRNIATSMFSDVTLEIRMRNLQRSFLKKKRKNKKNSVNPE